MSTPATPPAASAAAATATATASATAAADAKDHKSGAAAAAVQQPTQMPSGLNASQTAEQVFSLAGQLLNSRPFTRDTAERCRELYRWVRHLADEKGDVLLSIQATAATGDTDMRLALQAVQKREYAVVFEPFQSCTHEFPSPKPARSSALTVAVVVACHSAGSFE